MRYLLYSVVIFLSNALFSQRGRVIFNYSPSVAIGSTHSFIEKMSWRGSNLDFRFELADHIEVGVLVAWNYLYERRDREVYSSAISSGTIDVSAVQSRYLNIVPVTAQAYYYFEKSADKVIWPYAGLNVGAYSVDYEKYWGNLIDQKELWSFGFAPSLGFLMPVPEGNVSLNVQARYNFVAFKYAEVNNISFFDFNVGLSFDL